MRVCSRYNARSDWLILGHYTFVMPTGRLRACKTQAKSHTINKLLASKIRSLLEDLALLILLRQGLGLRFPLKTLLSANK